MLFGTRSSIWDDWPVASNGIYHGFELTLPNSAKSRDVVHAFASAKMTFYHKCSAHGHGAEYHTVYAFIVFRGRWLRYVTVGLLGNVGQVDAKSKHVAFVPVVLGCAFFTTIVADACAETLPTRDGAIFSRTRVRWRLQAMSVQDIKDVVVGAVVQLDHFGLLLVLVCQVSAKTFVKIGQGWVIYRPNADDFGLAVMKRC